jgi:hypothetical protein
MTRQNPLRRRMTTALAGGAIAMGMVMGLGSATASADVLDDIGAQYMQGAGGGQLSNWVKEALQLRALGFKPSKGNLAAMTAAMDHLPNQTPLVDALKATVAYQRKIQAQMQNSNTPASGGGFSYGVNQPPGGTYGPGVGVVVPVPGGNP